jgi:drug/metabolite transporter (DMT)-like permease
MAGELAALSAAILWAGSFSLYSRFGRNIPSDRLSAFKYTVSAGCLLAAAALARPPLPDNRGDWALLAASGVLGLALGEVALMAALKRLGAHLTSTLQCLVAPLVTLLGMGALNEHPGPREALGMALTVGAVASVVGMSHRGEPDASKRGQRRLGLLYAVLFCAAQSVGLVAARRAMQASHVLSGTLLRILPALAILLLAIAARSRAAAGGPPLERRQLLALTGAALTGGAGGMLLLSAGMKYAKAGVVAALSSSYPVWILPIAAFFLGERIRWQAAIATVAAVAGIFLLLWPG